jgi:integrase
MDKKNVPAQKKNISRPAKRTEKKILIIRGDLKQRMIDTLGFQQLGLRKKSAQTIASIVKTFCDWADTQNIFDMKDIEKNQALKFFQYLIEEKKLHPTTLTTYRFRLKSFFKDFNPNPFDSIKSFAGGTTPAKPFSHDEVEKLKAYMLENDPQLWLFVRFIFYTLIRPNSELRLMKIGDIDFEFGRITIPAHIAKNKRYQTVVIPSTFLSQIQHLKKFPKDYFIFSKSGEPSEKPTAYNYFYNKHCKALEANSLKFGKYQLYGWKHTGALAMIRAGIPMKQVQMQGRWHSLDQMDEYLRGFGLNDMPDVERFCGL